MFGQKKSPRGKAWGGIILGTLTAAFTVALALGAEQQLRPQHSYGITPGEVVVDPNIQKIADQALADAIASENAKAGFAIVADPYTGKILAVANIDTTRKLTGYWSLAEEFEPASVAKTLVAAQAINDGLTNPDESLSCENGYYRYGAAVSIAIGRKKAGARSPRQKPSRCRVTSAPSNLAKKSGQRDS